MEIPIRAHANASPTLRVSRRGFMEQTIMGAAAAGCLAGCATGPKVPGKTPKQEAQYQDVPNGFQKCGSCKHFISPNACEVVAGPVQGHGWCRFYTLF